MTTVRSAISIVGIALLVACGPITYGGTDQTYSPWQLRYRLMDALGTLFYCDPDYYPVARGDEAELAIEHFPEIQQDSTRFAAILEHLGWQGRTQFSDDDKLAIYRESKQLNAIYLDPVDDSYAFRISVNENAGHAHNLSGDIDVHGRIVVRKQELGIATCPICLPGDAAIATPDGDIAVRDVHKGTVVWSTDHRGQRIAVTVLRTRVVPVPKGHLLTRVSLSDGRAVIASPTHPTADGRMLGELLAGDELDGARVVVVRTFASREPATYDLLPASPTGAYWANGVLIGSTLQQPLRALW